MILLNLYGGILSACMHLLLIYATYENVKVIKANPCLLSSNFRPFSFKLLIVLHNLLTTQKYNKPVNNLNYPLFPHIVFFGITIELCSSIGFLYLSDLYDCIYDPLLSFTRTMCFVFVVEKLYCYLSDLKFPTNISGRAFEGCGNIIILAVSIGLTSSTKQFHTSTKENCLRILTLHLNLPLHFAYIS